MDLIVDANVIFSALIAGQGMTHELLFRNTLQLHSPEFIQEEIKKHKVEITQKTKLSEQEIDLALSILFSRIKIIPSQETNLIQAEKISPDPDDSEYFALAIKLKCPIWSNDKRLKQQDKIKIINTTELIKLLK